MAKGTIWFTGLSGAGKTTVAATLKAMLDSEGVQACILDGDDLRTGLNADLDYSIEARKENVRRVGEVAALFSKTGHLCLVTLISPFEDGRESVRARHGELGVPFVEVYVATPIEVCAERDPKGLYARAKSGEVKSFTGLTSPYEPPEAPDCVLETEERSPEESAKEVFALLDRRRLLELSR